MSWLSLSVILIEQKYYSFTVMNHYCIAHFFVGQSIASTSENFTIFFNKCITRPANLWLQEKEDNELFATESKCSDCNTRVDNTAKL